MTDSVHHPKILQTHVPLFRGNREKHNHTSRACYVTTPSNAGSHEKTNQKTLAQVLRYFKNEHAREDLKKVTKYKFGQIRNDPSAETFNDFLNKYKKVAKQAFGTRSGDITETFLFAKLLPATSSAQLLNQISSPHPPIATPRTSNSQPQQNREIKRKFDGQCRHCGIHGHK